MNEPRRIRCEGGEDLLISADRLAQLGRFVPLFAHEINNCFQAIGGLAELAVDDPTISPSVAGRLRRIAAQLEKGQGTIRQLLALARERTAAVSRVDLVPLAEGVLALRGDALSRLQVDVEFDREGAPVVALGSPRELEQLLLALVLNAEDALRAASGPRRLRLSLRVENGVVSIRLSDTGVGVEEGLAGTMFEAFVTNKDSAEHAGLGLAAARAIVERHDGTIAWDRTASPGTTLVVTLPAM